MKQKQVSTLYDKYRDSSNSHLTRWLQRKQTGYFIYIWNCISQSRSIMIEILIFSKRSLSHWQPKVWLLVVTTSILLWSLEYFQSSFHFPTLLSLVLFFFFFCNVDDFHFSPLVFVSSHPFPWFPAITAMQKIAKSASPFVSLFLNSNYTYSNEFVKTCPPCSDITPVQLDELILELFYPSMYGLRTWKVSDNEGNHSTHFICS